MKEIEIKKVLIESLINGVDSIISSEFRFDFGTRRADVICMEQGNLIAFEIKGAGDNTDRLESQIESYKKYFDFCFIVCEKVNLPNIRRITPKSIGILVVNNDGVTKVRAAKLIKKQDKATLASTIDVRFLRKIVSNKKARSKHDLCEVLSTEKTLDQVRDISRKDLLLKITEPYKAFLNELGKKIHSDDILILTRMPSRELI